MRCSYKVFSLLLAFVFVFAAVKLTSARVIPGYEVYVYIDGNRLMFPDQQPFIDENNRTMVPLRPCAEALGAVLNWNSDSQQVEVSLPDNGKEKIAFTLTIGEKQVQLHPQGVKEMDSAVILKNNRTMVPLRFISEYLHNEVLWDGKSKTVHVFTRKQSENEKMQIMREVASSLKELPRINTEENLQRLLDESNSSNNKQKAVLGQANIQREAMENMAADMAASEYSQTNTQVEGVDEADIIKTDGEYIYQIKNNSVQIIKAFPSSEMALKSEVQLQENLREVYIDANRLIIINDERRYQIMPARETEEYSVSSPVKIYTPLPPSQPKTVVKIYDTSDKSSPVLIDQYALGGYYLSSRKIENKVYLFTNENIFQPYEPRYYINNKEYIKHYSEIAYFPGIIHNSYLHIAQITLSNKNNLAVQSFLGSGNNVYCSRDSLYIAVEEYFSRHDADNISEPREKTLLYKFNLRDNVEYAARGTVPGIVLNQFSMDEYNNYFRLATTTSGWSAENSSNAVYILDSNLNMVNSIENIAPGERIYSARFMGDRAYLVTFRQMDPFFVLDMNPHSPQILGKLKIPGFSNYLHPYGGNLVIGLGKDVVDSKWGPREAGLKLSLFDVGNVNNPLEIDKAVIGASGTGSEAANNHKAFFLYKNLVAFPITVYEKDGSYPDSTSFAFQGAYIYEVSAKGLQFKGRISHLSNQDYLKAGQYWYDSGNEVKRIIYINGNLYTISDQMIKASDASTLQEIKTLVLP